MANDYINAEEHNWNLPGELWNDDQEPRVVTRFLRPLPPDTQNFGSPALPRSPVVRDFNPDIDAAERDTAPAAPRQTYFTGGFAALRAMRVSHQHRVGFWNLDGPVRLLTASDTPDPNSAQLDQQYADLRLFSYLPEALFPTRSQFEDLARPQSRGAATQAQLGQVGVVAASAVVDDARIVDATNQPLLELVIPFSTGLDDFCQSRIKAVVSG